MLRERKTARIRCPWCHSGDSGQWVTCPRDDTKIHADCLAEYGTCPICRDPIGDERAPRPAHDVSFPVEPLPIAARQLLTSIRADYRYLGEPSTLIPYLLGSVGLTIGAGTLVSPWLAASLALLSAVVFVILKLAHRDPAAELLPGGARGELAQAVVAGDLRARAAHRQHADAASQAQAARNMIRALAAARREAYRLHLERTTPVEDARRIRGIGARTIEALQNDGLHTLSDLLRRPYLEQIEGISPDDARLLLDWGDDRVVAIARLADSGDFPDRDRVDDQAVGPQLRAAMTLGTNAQTHARQARDTLTAWAAKRPALREELGA